MDMRTDTASCDIRKGSLVLFAEHLDDPVNDASLQAHRTLYHKEYGPGPYRVVAIVPLPCRKVSPCMSAYALRLETLNHQPILHRGLIHPDERISSRPEETQFNRGWFVLAYES